MLLSYLCIAGIVFHYFAHPSLDGISETRWAADSFIYMALFNTGGLDQKLIQLGPNLFGPLVLLWIAGGSSAGIFLINIVLFVAAWALVVNNSSINRRVYFLALALSPPVFFSLLAVNKEIISMLVMPFMQPTCAKALLATC